MKTLAAKLAASLVLLGLIFSVPVVIALRMASVSVVRRSRKVSSHVSGK
jgi:hypothetical protein